MPPFISYDGPYIAWEHIAGPVRERMDGYLRMDVNASFHPGEVRSTTVFLNQWYLRWSLLILAGPSTATTLDAKWKWKQQR